MTITFCGHSKFSFDNTVKEKLRELLLQEIRKNLACKFYLGGYGDFDSLCLNILKEIKADFPAIELLFITPYLNDNYSKLETAKLYYDGIIYPPLENVPRRFCILKRNEWMVNHSARVIAVYNGQPGGTKNTIDYANKVNVPVIILQNTDE